MRLAKKVLLFALIVSFSLVRLPAAVLAEEGEEPPYITVPASGGEDGGDGDSPQGNVDTDGQSAPSAGGQQATGDLGVAKQHDGSAGQRRKLFQRYWRVGG